MVAGGLSLPWPRMRLLAMNDGFNSRGQAGSPGFSTLARWLGLGLPSSGARLLPVSRGKQAERRFIFPDFPRY